jgi:hypothetical protein
MKKILIALALIGAITNVNAKAIASMPNEAGGAIVITDEDCFVKGKKYDLLNKIYFYTPDGTTGSGCFYFMDGLIHAIWEDNTERKYPAKSFIPTKKGSQI